MISVTPQRFDELIDEALDELPHWVTARMDNVVVVSAERPAASQRQRLRSNELLLGLYEGVPISRRGRGYHLTPPDRITLFRRNLLLVSQDEADLVRRIRRTVAHEVGHHFGMNEQELRGAGV